MTNDIAVTDAELDRMYGTSEPAILMNGTQEAINAIRAIPQLFGADISAIVAALSCKVAASSNSHLETHQVACDSLDDLSNWLDDKVQA